MLIVCYILFQLNIEYIGNIRYVSQSRRTYLYHKSMAFKLRIAEQAKELLDILVYYLKLTIY